MLRAARRGNLDGPAIPTRGCSLVTSTGPGFLNDARKLVPADRRGHRTRCRLARDRLPRRPRLHRAVSGLGGAPVLRRLLDRSLTRHAVQMWDITSEGRHPGLLLLDLKDTRPVARSRIFEGSRCHPQRDRAVAQWLSPRRAVALTFISGSPYYVSRVYDSGVRKACGRLGNLPYLDFRTCRDRRLSVRSSPRTWDNPRPASRPQVSARGCFGTTPGRGARHPVVAVVVPGCASGDLTAVDAHEIVVFLVPSLPVDERERGSPAR